MHKHNNIGLLSKTITYQSLHRNKEMFNTISNLNWFEIH